jgi:predicted transcriptional regulator
MGIHEVRMEEKLENEFVADIYLGSFPSCGHPILCAITNFPIERKAVAELLGISNATLSQYTLGKKSVPVKHVPQLLEMLDTCIRAAKDSLDIAKEEQEISEKNRSRPLRKKSDLVPSVRFDEHYFRVLTEKITFAESVYENWKDKVDKMK